MYTYKFVYALKRLAELYLRTLKKNHIVECMLNKQNNISFQPVRSPG